MRYALPAAFAAIAAATMPASAQQSRVDIVKAFYEAGLNEKDCAKASQYLGSAYIQHNPKVEDGAKGLCDYIAILKKDAPERHSEIKRILESGYYVFTHVHTRKSPEDRGVAIMDIFRFEGDKIVEHWDVIQDVPKKSANKNTMF